MPQILLTTSAQSNTGAYQQGLANSQDIIGVFSDSHVFSDIEIRDFEIMQVTGYTLEQVKMAINLMRPTVAWVSLINGVWYWGKLDNSEEEKKIWQASNNKWYFIEKELKHGLNANALTQADKDILADPNATHGNKTSTIQKIRHKMDIVENQVELKKIFDWE